jgi:hypothetical protein
MVLHTRDWSLSRIAPGANLIAFSIRPISAKVPDAPARQDQVDSDVRQHWRELPCGLVGQIR